MQRRQDLRDLVLDMRRLPDEQRAALVLAELDSLSHEQIGEALGVPREKVKALVFQARESLVASRNARETDCSEIREQLATQRGGALRRANLRRHLRECAGCRDFRKQIEHQRRQLAVLLPVAPTIALKEGVLAGTIGGGAAAGVAGGGFVASTALKSGLVKVVVGAIVAGAGTAGTIVATHGLGLQTDREAARPAHQSAVGSSSLATAPAVSSRGFSAASLGRPTSEGAGRPVTGPTSSTGASWAARDGVRGRSRVPVAPVACFRFLQSRRVALGSTPPVSGGAAPAAQQGAPPTALGTVGSPAAAVRWPWRP